MMTTAQARRGLHIYHLDARDAPKHKENSLRAVRLVHESPKWNALDIDTLITKADPKCPICPPRKCKGHLMACHWDRPMERDGFHDPHHELRHDTRLRDMTVREARRLVAPGGYHIPFLSTMISHCARLDVIPVVEPKDDPRFELDWPWQLLHRLDVHTHAGLRVRTLRDFPKPGAGIRRRDAARRNDIPAWLI